MVVAQVAEQGMPDARRKPERTPSMPGIAWTSPAQLRRSLPMVRLLAEIWTIPQVSKVGLLADDAGIQVRVLLRDDDKAARSSIYASERAYLNATSMHGFKLRVTPIAKAGPDMPPPFETVLER